MSNKIFVVSILIAALTLAGTASAYQPSYTGADSKLLILKDKPEYKEQANINPVEDKEKKKEKSKIKDSKTVKSKKTKEDKSKKTQLKKNKKKQKQEPASENHKDKKGKTEAVGDNIKKESQKNNHADPVTTNYQEVFKDDFMEKYFTPPLISKAGLLILLAVIDKMFSM